MGAGLGTGIDAGLGAGLGDGQQVMLIAMVRGLLIQSKTKAKTALARREASMKDNHKGCAPARGPCLLS